MWYTKYGQALNVVGPIQPPINLPAPETPQNDEVIVPEGEAPPQETPKLVMPPVHDKCHCTIETMLGGRQIWQASHNPCPQCVAARNAFNEWQASIYGI